MSAFEKGHKKLGGRKKGTSNKATESIKNTLNALLTEDELEERWHYFWNHKDPMLRWKAFELYHHYRYGKPGRRSGRIAADQDWHQRDSKTSRAGMTSEAPRAPTNAEIYDPSTRQWSLTSSISGPVGLPANPVTLSDGDVLIANDA